MYIFVCENKKVSGHFHYKLIVKLTSQERIDAQNDKMIKNIKLIKSISSGHGLWYRPASEDKKNHPIRILYGYFEILKSNFSNFGKRVFSFIDGDLKAGGIHILEHEKDTDKIYFQA